MNPCPKPEKTPPKEKMTKWEFNKKYGSKLKKQNSKPKKGKGSDYSKLVETLDDWFSRFIRLRESNTEGIGHCVSCNKAKEVKYMDCGHFYSRGDKAVRWEESNCRLQCKQCNKFMGKPEINNAFRNALLKQGVNLDWLEIKKNNVWKPTKFELEVLIKDYRNKTNELLRKKGLKKWW